MISPIYPERVAKTYNEYNNRLNLNKKRLANALQEASSDLEKAKILNKTLKKSVNSSCITGVSVGYCSNNHLFYKPVFCGKEHCTFCGQDKSPAHNRRVSRVIDVVQSWSAVSYFVITVPEEARLLLTSKDNLNKYRNFIRRKLKRDGFTTALLRWHWAGSCKHCNKSTRDACTHCNATGAGDEYEPHLNILTPAGNTQRTTKAGKVKKAVSCYNNGQHTVKAEYLQEWRDSIRQWFKDNFGINSEGNIYHNFIGPNDKNRRAKIYHKVRYVLRATLRNKDLALAMASMLFKYRNTSQLGVWEKRVSDKPLNCPCCGDVLKWYGEPSNVFFSGNKRLIEVDSGLFYVKFNDS